MIRVDRSDVEVPPSLSQRKYGPGRDQTEREAILAELNSHVIAGRPLDAFRYGRKYKAYRQNDVKKALSRLFNGKCAYCETRYAGAQPMDVEHWRPKAVVKERDNRGLQLTRLGYPWLASAWENLLPSCIDCNRERLQTDAITGVEETIGKANQFPITSSRWYPPLEGIEPSDEDVPLLLNPTVDEPSDHLEFGNDGTVLPRNQSSRGAASIRVYALNRSELAFERLGLARLIEQRLTTIEKLVALMSAPTLSNELRLVVEDLVSHEINALYQMTEPDRPYSEMARQIIEANAPV